MQFKVNRKQRKEEQKLINSQDRFRIDASGQKSRLESTILVRFEYYTTKRSKLAYFNNFFPN